MVMGFIENLLFEASVWVLPVIFAVTFHEAAHAGAAALLGDPTARSLGRLTLNPVRHIDPFGTVVLPLLCLISPLPLVFGYAKPVPVDVNRLRNPRRDMILVAAAGPIANVLLMLASACLLYLPHYLPVFMGPWLLANLQRSLLLNAILAVFNMLPIPPLDGGRIVVGLLPYPLAIRYARLERYGMLIVIGLIMVVPALISQLGLGDGVFNNLFSVPVTALIDLVLLMVGLS